tara:strand:- start:631 stop:747 length:117 start_codon:yes stop_codon:yes gene_type:complete
MFWSTMLYLYIVIFFKLVSLFTDKRKSLLALKALAIAI